MSLSDRDRKVAIVLVPLVLIGAFAFLVMKPKREEAAKAAKALSAQQERRDQAVARERQLQGAKQSFVADYTTVVRLGKAVPTSVDMASVIVQLERAAHGTKIDFGKIATGPRIPAAGGGEGAGGTAAGSSAGGGNGSSSSGQPVAAGGAQAQSGPGKTVEKANNGAATSEQTTASRESASPETGTQTSTSSGQGSLPVGGGSAASGGGSGQSSVAGLDSIPLELTFTGSFFDLADLFHSLKRFVGVANQELFVRGRLMTIDAFSFGSDESFPKIEAQMKARIFLAPKQQGATAGASPSGPSAASGGSGTAPASTPETASPTTAAAPGYAAP